MVLSTMEGIGLFVPYKYSSYGSGQFYVGAETGWSVFASALFPVFVGHRDCSVGMGHGASDFSDVTQTRSNTNRTEGG